MTDRSDEIIQYINAYVKDQNAWKPLADMSYSDWMTLPSDIAELLAAHVFSSGAAISHAALAGRIRVSIAAHIVISKPLTPRVLSRQYGRTAQRIGAKLTDIMSELCFAQHIRTVEFEGSKVWVPVRMLTEMVEMSGDDRRMIVEAQVEAARRAWDRPRKVRQPEWMSIICGDNKSGVSS